jgi:hypothetical protein
MGPIGLLDSSTNASDQFTDRGPFELGDSHGEQGSKRCKCEKQVPWRDCRGVKDSFAAFAAVEALGHHDGYNLSHRCSNRCPFLFRRSLGHDVSPSFIDWLIAMSSERLIMPEMHAGRPADGAGLLHFSPTHRWHDPLAWFAT